MSVSPQDLRSLQPLSSLDRRTFVTTALASGFAAATLPVSASTLVTDTAGLEAGETKIPVRVLAVAPELFARQGNPATVSDMAALMRDIVSRVPDAQVMSDLDATVSWARSHGGRLRVGITGFCWGGRITWLYAAHSPEVAAGVAWYGRVVGTPSELQPQHPVDLAAKLRAPVLGLYAGRDGGIPLQSVDAMRSALSQAGVSRAAAASTIVVYPEAQHGFYADYRASYRPEDAIPAFARACEWFRANGVALAQLKA
jgi:carboxymethylenebutenolidase